MRRWLRFVPAGLLTLAWVLTMLTPPSVKPLTGELVAFVFGAVAAIAAVLAGFKVPRSLFPAAIALGVGLLGMGVGVLAHPQPLQSALGVVGQHNGWLLWLSMPLWIYAGVSAGIGRPLRLTLWSVAVLGGVAALFAVLDAAHIFEVGARYSPEVSGLLESSISLGQILLLALGATGALVLGEKQPALRLSAVGLLALEVVALALSGARGAQVSFVIGLALLGVWQAWPRMSVGVRRAVEVTGAVLAGTAVLFIAYAAVVGPTARGMARFETLLSNRVTIWHSAAAHFPARLILGAGTDRFTSVINWAVVPGGGLPYTVTTSPHNIVLDWLLAGGLLAAVGMASAFVLLATRVVVSPQARWIASRALAVGVAAWALSLALSWVDPLSLAVAGLATGTLLATRQAEEEAEKGGGVSVAQWIVSAVLLLVTFAVALAGARLFPLERSWAEESASGQMQVSADVARWQAWPDPAFASRALNAALQSGDTAAMRQVGPEALHTVPYNAEVDILCSVTSTYLAAKAPPGTPVVAACVAGGRSADPASGIWSAIERLLSGH